MIILDTGATRALADGHKTLNLLAANMARTPGDLLRIPALCLMQAESEDADAARRVLAFSSVVVDPLDTVSSVTVGTMDATAKAGVNYQATRQVLTFLPGQTTKQFAVTIYDNAKITTPVAFFAMLSGSNLSIKKASGVGLISN